MEKAKNTSTDYRKMIWRKKNTPPHSTQNRKKGKFFSYLFWIKPPWGFWLSHNFRCWHQWKDSTCPQERDRHTLARYTDIDIASSILSLHSGVIGSDGSETDLWDFNIHQHPNWVRRPGTLQNHRSGGRVPTKGPETEGNRSQLSVVSEHTHTPGFDVNQSTPSPHVV